jgi:genome maintenance exonuclease 1
LEPLELVQVNAETGRYYITPEGNHYSSVTTVLGRRGKEDIDKWKDAVGQVEATKIGRRASTRGATLHENCEDYLLNHTVHIEKSRYVDMSLFRGVQPVLHRINNIRLLESPLYSHAMKLAGTMDCLAEFDGVLSVIDFKTTTKMKEKYEIDNYFIQTSIYASMIYERYGINVSNLVIIISNEFGSTQVYTDNRKNWFNQVKEVIDAI